MGEKSAEFYGSRVIAAARDEQSVERACRSRVPAVFLLGGDIDTLPRWLEMLGQYGKLSFVHIDLAEGIGKDRAGVRHIAQTLKPDGLISTKAQLLRYAKEEGLIAVQRAFLVDSSSLETAVKLARVSNPDYLEVLPGLVPKAITFFSETLEIPVIAGGMVVTAHEAQIALDAGAAAVSTTSEPLWELA